MAGTSAVNNTEEGTATGTVNFSQNSINLDISVEQAIDLVQTILEQVGVAISNPGITESLQIQLITGSPLSDVEMQLAIQAIQVVQAQGGRGSNILRNRRPSSTAITAAATTIDNIKAAIIAYGGTQETAELTIELIDRLELSPTSATTLTMTELNLLVQGLGNEAYLGSSSQINRISPKRLLKSIEVFNTLVSQLTPAQLLIASQDPQLLAIKQLLEKMSESIVAIS